uniref:Uncharacterized protein n=1 Tax=Rhizophora mucronata TaxID=61149 RepID=A0A2P2K3N8_RHIMU
MWGLCLCDTCRVMQRFSLKNNNNKKKNLKRDTNSYSCNEFMLTNIRYFTKIVDQLGNASIEHLTLCIFFWVTRQSSRA